MDEKQYNKEYYRKNTEKAKARRRAYYYNHKEQEKQRHKEWVSKNREELRVYNREYRKGYCQRNKEHLAKCRLEWRAKLKLEVLAYYGNGKVACVICNESRLPCLTIDHIAENGAEERRTIKPNRGHRFGGIDFYSWLKQGNYPKGYQTLCMNCQWVKREQAKYDD